MKKVSVSQLREQQLTRNPGIKKRVMIASGELGQLRQPLRFAIAVDRE